MKFEVVISKIRMHDACIRAIAIRAQGTIWAFAIRAQAIVNK